MRSKVHTIRLTALMKNVPSRLASRATSERRVPGHANNKAPNAPTSGCVGLGAGRHGAERDGGRKEGLIWTVAAISRGRLSEGEKT
jgi:hypothetical protein